MVVNKRTHTLCSCVVPFNVPHFITVKVDVETRYLTKQSSKAPGAGSVWLLTLLSSYIRVQTKPIAT